MSRITVRRGTKYKARVQLGFLESMASNDLIAGKFRAVGFTDVVVTGTGGTRWATGTWPNADASADMPSQVVAVEVVS